MASWEKQCKVISTRIERKCVQKGDCLVWQGQAKTAKGRHGQYGKIHIRFKDSNGQNIVNTTMVVSRAYWLAKNNLHLLPKDIDISHLCHNTLCVAIDHLVAEHHNTNQERITCNKAHACTLSHTPRCLFK